MDYEALIARAKGKLAGSDVTAIRALLAERDALRDRLAEADGRHKAATQNWTQAAVDAQRKGDRELSIAIQNMVLSTLKEIMQTKHGGKHDAG